MVRKEESTDCAVNKFASASRVAATLPSPPQGSTVHCEMFNIVLALNSIKSLISLSIQNHLMRGQSLGLWLSAQRQHLERLRCHCHYQHQPSSPASRDL